MRGFKEMSWLSIAFIGLSAFPAAQSKERFPLVAENITIQGQMVEFRLVNIGSKPITAWRAKVEFEVGGDTQVSEFAKDFAIGTVPPEAAQRTGSRHAQGSLMPFSYHVHRLPVGMGVEVVRVQVSSVVFDDLTSQGPSKEVSRVFENRLKLKEDCELLLTRLHAIQEEAPEAALQKDLLRFADDLEEGVDLRRRQSAPKRSDGVRVTMARSIRRSLQMLAGVRGDPAALTLEVVTRSLERQLDALRRHTPDPRKEERK